MPRWRSGRLLGPHHHRWPDSRSASPRDLVCSLAPVLLDAPSPGVQSGSSRAQGARCGPTMDRMTQDADRLLIVPPEREPAENPLSPSKHPPVGAERPDRSFGAGGSHERPAQARIVIVSRPDGAGVRSGRVTHRPSRRVRRLMCVATKGKVLVEKQTRRSFQRKGALTAAVIGSPAQPGCAAPAVRQVKLAAISGWMAQQAPGFYRSRLGDFRITVLSGWHGATRPVAGGTRPAATPAGYPRSGRLHRAPRRRRARVRRCRWRVPCLRSSRPRRAPTLPRRPGTRTAVAGHPHDALEWLEESGFAGLRAPSIREKFADRHAGTT
jgi:hypothetical protein